MIMNKEEKIALIRKTIQENKYPLKFDYSDVYFKGNYYSYIFGSKYEEIVIFGEEYIYNLGCISNQSPATNSEEAEKNFIKDMEVLGIQVRKSYLDEITLDGEWKVVLFYDKCFDGSYDFHFARQNKGGEWSHRKWINGPIELLGENPEGCTDLSFVSYYILKIDTNSIF